MKLRTESPHRRRRDASVRSGGASIRPLRAKTQPRRKRHRKPGLFESLSRSLNGYRNSYVKFGVDRNAIAHRRKEPPLLERVEQDLVQLGNRRWLRQGYVVGSVGLDDKMSYRDRIDLLVAQIVGNGRRWRIDRAGARCAAAEVEAAPGRRRGTRWR